MKVKIRKYPSWVGPYQLVEKLCFWIPKEVDEYGFPRTAERVHDWGDWLAHTWFGGVWSRIAERWLDFHEKRRVNVRIDKWDTWNMNESIAYIALPMLKQLKASKHGAPYVDPQDVPKELQPKKQTKKQKYNGEVDNTHFQRWDWVMDEMIYAFESVVGDNADWESKYHTGTMDRIFVPVDRDGNEVPEDDASFYRWDKGPNDTSHFDADGYKQEADRIQNGFRLFGKYYQNLWD